MSLLLKNGMILTLDDENRVYERGDVLIEGRFITLVGHDTQVDPDTIDQVIDASGMLIMPGLINAHVHSGENMMKGLASGLPNELWNLTIWPPVGGEHFEPRLHYLQTMLGAIEMIKTGTTTVQDQDRHWYQSPYDGVAEAYFGAIADIGIRLAVPIALIDRPWHETILGLADALPTDILAQLQNASQATAWQLDSTDKAIRVCEDAINRWHGFADLVTLGIGPSSIQRCSEELLREAGNLARVHDVPLHIHLLESRLQKYYSQQVLNDRTVRYLRKLGLLESRTSIAHAVWVSDEDIKLLADADATVVHIPVCNLFMGSGVMPYAKMVEAEIHMALATDGVSANGSFSMFETIKMATLLHTVSTPDYEKWPIASHVLHMATRGGARSIGLDGQVGVVEAGQIADLILLDMQDIAFTPLNNVVNRVVYSQDRETVDTVIINGQVVMHNRRLVNIEEEAILEEIRTYEPLLKKIQSSAQDTSQRLFPILSDLYYRTSLEQEQI